MVDLTCVQVREPAQRQCSDHPHDSRSIHDPGCIHPQYEHGQAHRNHRSACRKVHICETNTDDKNGVMTMKQKQLKEDERIGAVDWMSTF